MRSSTEISNFAKSNGMDVEIRERGMSYRAGGDIVCFPEGMDWREEEIVVKCQRNAGFDGTGYDNRGRHYDLWLIKPAQEGEEAYKVCTQGSYFNAKEEDRLCIGREDEGKSGCNPIYLIKVGSDNLGDLKDLFDGFILQE